MDPPIKKEEGIAHKLYDNWTLWVHLPHDTDWSINSYKKIFSFNTIEQSISLIETLPEKMVINCMLFLMRSNIKPMWEDSKNKDGGCFSYRIQNNSVENSWKSLAYHLVGESLTENDSYSNLINGIGISPKKKFCVIKIWLANCSAKDPGIITPIKGFTSHGCLFKKHIMN
jgi:hypothetical protein